MSNLRPVNSALIDLLAQQYDKPVEYVTACIKAHEIKSIPIIRYADDGFADFFSDMTAIFDLTPSRTKQEFTAECDINVIMSRFKASGGDLSTLPLNSRKAMYGDFTNAPDSYHAALNFVKDTEQAFMTLDAKVRARFDNNPQALLDFLADSANTEEAISLGLISAVVAPVASETAEGATTAKVSKKPSKSSPNDDSDGEGVN